MNAKTKALSAHDYTPPDYEWNHKTRSAYANGTGVVPQLIAIHDNVAEDSLARMNSDDERFALFDGITHTLSVRIDHWIDLYNAIQMLEKHPGYWKARGYKSFEVFLADKLGTSLAQWKELEELYHYAATACPELFNINQADVAKLRKAIEEIAPAKKRGGDRPAKTDLVRTMAEAAAYKPAGQNTLPRIIGVLKRSERFYIIEKALTEANNGVIGNFVKQDRLGNKRWNVAAFEKAAGMQTRADRRKQAKRSFARDFAKTVANTNRAEILTTLRRYPWIVKGLCRGK